MSVEFYRGSPGKFDSRTLSRETLSRWTGRNTNNCFAGPGPEALATQITIITIIIVVVVLLLLLMIINNNTRCDNNSNNNNDNKHITCIYIYI